MRRALPDPPISLPAQHAAGSQTETAWLWLAVYFPTLSLDAIQAPRAVPYAVVEAERASPIIYAVSAAAQAQGIAANMPLTAAQTYCPQLKYAQRDPQAETDLLKQHAESALEFSSWVSLAHSHSLLLEVRGSLKLFEDFNTLIDELINKFNTEVTWALSPSPSASVLLAQHAPSTLIETPAALRSVLGSLSVKYLPFKDKTLKRILTLGAHQLRDLWRLPTDSFSRRIGMEESQYLKQLIGQDNQIPSHFFKPPKFFSKQSLWQEVYQHQHFLPLIEQLIQQLCQFLHKRDAACDTIQIHLYHSNTLFTPMHVHSAQASRESGYFMHLIQLKLERLPINHSINGASVKCDQIYPYLAENEDLFHTKQSLHQEWSLLEEQLKARLGEDCLKQLYAPAEHRPEKAFSFHSVKSEAAPHLRPLWLLPKPIACDKPQGLTDYPERIEAGWWDEQPIRRDYYRLVTAQGQRLWVFHDLTQQRWYIHGLFG
ncbi:MAG TPA: hypothetical protein DCZ03_14830 [Gammaproteobacteria bacterium]|nr:hypothetical protein [Gammaproteobacteria bacterium]